MLEGRERSKGHGARSKGRKKEIGDRKLEDGRQRSEVGGRKTEDGRQRSEVGSQKSEVKDQKSEGGGSNEHCILGALRLRTVSPRRNKISHSTG